MKWNWLHPTESNTAQTHQSAPAYRIQGADLLSDKCKTSLSSLLSETALSLKEVRLQINT